MFDAPPNLPVEPSAPSGTPPQNIPPAPAAEPQKMQGGINISGTKEPEDIFAGIKESPSQSIGASTTIEPTAPKNGIPWKIVLGIVIPLAIIGIGVGGYLVYTKFFSEPAGSLVTDTGKSVAPTSIPSTSEPVGEAPVTSPVPEPDTDRMAASQASMALLKAQAEQEMAAAENATDTAMMETDIDDLFPEESVTGTEMSSGDTFMAEGMEITEEESTPVAAEPPLKGIDSDDDGLTNSEESLLGSDPNATDTDEDGFSDGSEVANGYDPSAPKSILAESKHIIKERIGSVLFAMPNTWKRNAGPAGTVILYTGTPASINISMQNYASRDELIDWLIETNQGTGVQDYISGLNANGGNVVYSKDKLTAWMLMGNTVYTLRYSTNGGTVMDFGMIYEYIIKSATLSQ